MWWNTIVSPTGKEKTGYPTQKPLKILERIVRVHSDPGDLVVDFFAGSGTTGEAAARHGRGYLLVDANPEAIEVMARAALRGTRRSSWTARASCPERDGGRLLAEPAPEASGALRRGHSGTIASLGQDSTQVAQSSHFSASMT